MTAKPTQKTTQCSADQRRPLAGFFILAWAASCVLWAIAHLMMQDPWQHTLLVTEVTQTVLQPLLA